MGMAGEGESNGKSSGDLAGMVGEGMNNRERAVWIQHEDGG